MLAGWEVKGVCIYVVYCVAIVGMRILIVGAYDERTIRQSVDVTICNPVKLPRYPIPGTRYLNILTTMHRPLR